MTVRVLVGDVREQLKKIDDESVHVVVTSPPYYGLRDYGTARWDGGDPECDHQGPPMATAKDLHNAEAKGHKVAREVYKDKCGKCGAKRIDSQIGLEETPEQFVQQLVEVFREVRRVLRSDGTCFVNLGDSYGEGKQLLGVPWRFAFAMQSDGWVLRQEIIWHKPSPMPESVTDRCTKSHEHIFMFAKTTRYFFDQEAIREEPKAKTETKLIAFGESKSVRSMAASTTRDMLKGTKGDTQRLVQYEEIKGANRRSVWSLSQIGSAEGEKHYATFPQRLPELCIKAGSSKYCCSECGAPFKRDVEKVKASAGPRGTGKVDKIGRPRHGEDRSGQFVGAKSIVKGYGPSCSCKKCEPTPSVVLDPFFGSGTTGIVAEKLGRDAIGIDLNPTFAEAAQKRVRRNHHPFARY